MWSPALMRLSVAVRLPVLSADSALLSGRVGGAWCRLAGLRLVGSSAPLVRPVCWDSFGTWGTRTDLDPKTRTWTRTRDPDPLAWRTWGTGTDLDPQTRTRTRTRDPDLDPKTRTRDPDPLAWRTWGTGTDLDPKTRTRDPDPDPKTRTRDPDPLAWRTWTRDPDLDPRTWTRVPDLDPRTRTRVQVGTSSVQGSRRHNEDRLRVAHIHDNLLYAAVFDGHGGSHAAEYCHTAMEEVIREVLEVEDDLENVLKKVFLETDERLKSRLGDSAPVGTTATVAMLRDGVELVVGSVGDSRAVLCRGGGAYALTADHTPDRHDERLRVSRCGGFFTWNGVGDVQVNGRLAVTRSIGDFHLKNSGLIAEPDTKRITVQRDSDSFLTLTTDGVNFLLSDQEMCDVISQCDDPADAADVITQQVLQYGGEDNASIVVVPLGAWGARQTQTRTQTRTQNQTRTQTGTRTQNQTQNQTRTQTQTRTQNQTQNQTQTRTPSAVYSLSRTFTSGARWA